MNIKIEYKQIAKLYKLTVAKDEVRIKLPENVDEGIKTEILKLSCEVAKRIYTSYVGTERGYWVKDPQQGYWTICMMGNNRKKDMNFYEKELLNGMESI